MNQDKVDERVSRTYRYEPRKIALIISLIVFGLGTLATYALAGSLAANQRQERVLKNTQQLTAIGSYIESRMASYRQALRGAAGMVGVVGRENLSEEDWNEYVDSLRVGQRFSELMGIGIVDVVKKDQVLAYEQAEGVNVHPDQTPHDFYGAIRYLEPKSDVNIAAIGFDMFNEQVRNDAMTKAMDHADASLSGYVTAVQDRNLPKDKRPTSLIMYYPLYRNNIVPDTVEQRRAALTGYAYLIFRPSDVFSQQDVLDKSTGYQYRVVDVTDNKNRDMVVRTAGFDSEYPFIVSGDKTVNDRKWDVSIYTANQDGSLVNPLGMFAGGIVGSLGLAAASYTILMRRTTRLQLSHEQQLQSAKDELLALASHQLRTPATGVRQYISMLQQGYFGELNQDQSGIANKAYRANERQLEIIDQLLIVAKADAGQLVISSDTLNMTDLVERAVDLQRQNALDKKITFVKKIQKDVELFADERYVMMIVENLISNAIKYSYPESKVRVRLATDAENIVLTVVDRGVGIDSSNQSKLFDKFSRINNPLSRKEGGSGLGLYLAQKLAQSQGGDIRVKSELNVGSEFVLILPKNRQTHQSVVQLTD